MLESKWYFQGVETHPLTATETVDWQDDLTNRLAKALHDGFQAKFVEVFNSVVGENMETQDEQPSVNGKPVFAWVCRTCGKVDFADEEERRAAPFHVPHRGYDIGSCPGRMIPVFKE